MKFEVYKTPFDFYPEVQSFLYKNEVTNSLMIGILKNANKERDYSQDFYCLGHDKEIKIVMVISGLHIIIATEDASSLKSAADFVAKADLKYPGVIGPRPFVDQFVEALNQVDSKSLSLMMSQRIYRLDKVDEINKPSGYMRFARMEDLDLLIDWTIEFAFEGTIDREVIRKNRKADIENKTMFIWDDNGAVSMTALRRSVGDGVTVSMVYTPDHERRKGYATALVAEVSLYALKSHKYCSLYTDLSNPTSNSIYQKIGYRPIVDSALYTLE
ncbi:GNAT family N-acetyltransferase [Acidaminobacter sp. JC074]|uniref:GNAT family N-acetyltransferase n=1 Tax=Acidaminobacter sp. JC074 TaxID=2530199 RepID=UPI001F0D6ABA|nr:GNAT family N-acetyltransferase [Acidaminobacter sp. JC074]MCH4887704.1 GNAT family N-acetyltransferase [Acidaminobacter sp. JC074]